jgi:(p)ppGpp synthase/HD superfamily hydrolase
MSNKLKLAQVLSAYAHEDQFYGKNDYYSTHIVDVVRRVTEKIKCLPDDWQEDYLIVAYLHDVLEDADYLSESIEDFFGWKIADVVCLLSKTFKVISFEDGDAYRVSPKPYKYYINDIRQNEIALLVKICDTESNLEASIADGNHKRIDKYTKQLEMLLE